VKTMMTREEVLAEMEADFKFMTVEEQEEPFFADTDGKELSPKDLIEAVRNDTEFGKQYVRAWSDNKEAMAFYDATDLIDGD